MTRLQTVLARPLGALGAERRYGGPTAAVIRLDQPQAVQGDEAQRPAVRAARHDAIRPVGVRQRDVDHARHPANRREPRRLPPTRMGSLLRS